MSKNTTLRTTARHAGALAVVEQHPALLAGLDSAVPLRSAGFARRSVTYRAELERHCADVLAIHGDRLLRSAPGCTWAFNTLADGLGLAAMCPGGANFARLHWCADPHPGCPELRRRMLLPGSSNGIGSHP